MALSKQELSDTIIYSLINGESLSSILLKVQLFSKLINVQIFTEWVYKELNGYQNDNDLPEYRKLEASAVKVIFTNELGENQMFDVPRGLIDEKYSKEIFTFKFKETISELENFEKIGREDFQNNLIRYLPVNYFKIIEDCYEGTFHRTYKLYQLISAISTSAITDTIKSRLLDFMYRLSEDLNLEMTFDFNMKKITHNIFNGTINAQTFTTGDTNITNDISNILIGNQTVVSLTDHDKDELQKILNQLSDLNRRTEEDKEELAEYLSELKNEISKKNTNPTIVRKLLRAIKSMGVVVRDKMLEIGIEKVIEMLGTYIP